MRLTNLTIILSLMQFSCMTYTPIDKSKSEITISADNKLTIDSTNTNYFMSGYLFNASCEFDGASIKNINITDTVFFYKIKNYDKYLRGTSPFWIFDITKDNPLSLPAKLSNLTTIPNSFDINLKTKINEQNKRLLMMINSPMKLKKYGLEYDNKKFVNNGFTNLSYYIDFNIPRVDQGSMIIDSIIIDSLEDHPLVTDIIYFESYNKNYKVNSVKICHVYDFGYYKTNNFENLSWDFEETDTMNYLIIRFKMEKHPIGNISKHGIRVKINGTYRNK